MNRSTHFIKQSMMLMVSMLLSFFAISQDKPSWRTLANARGANLYEVQKEVYQYWEGKQIGKGQDYKTFKRWENFVKPRVYPSGDLSLTSTNYQRYQEWVNDNSVNARSVSGNWTAVGPLTKALGYDAGVGLAKFVRFDPNNPNILYVGTPDGGLWKSVNGGDFWTLMNDDLLPIIACSDLAIDPINTQIMYLATGNWDGGKKSIGVLKSTDGGGTWDATGLSWTVDDNYIITKMVMDPTASETMIITTDGGIFKTTDGWETYSNPYCCDHLNDIEFKPGDPNTVYAAGSTFWQSTDKGETWAQITDGFPDANSVSRTAIGVSPANPDYVYALTGNLSGGLNGLYLSTDGGATFSLQADSPNLLSSMKDGTGSGGQAEHDMDIAVSPADADIVTVGGINQWQSTDGGVNWELVAYWLGNDVNYPGAGDSSPDYVHADIQSLEYQPGSSEVLFATCDGGISKSTDNGAHWTDISHNLVIAQQTCVALSATSPDIMVTGLQDIGTLKNGNGTWSVINGGDGESAFIDRSSDEFIVTSNPNGSHALSTDGGLTKSDITGLPSGEWFSPISQDPVNIDLIYAGGRPKLWKTLELFSVGASCDWTELGQPTGTGNILEYAVAPSDNSVIYAIKYDAVSKSADAGNTWTDLTGTLPVGGASLKDIAVSNTDPLKVWVVFSGYNEGDKVFKTTDGGASWTNISAGLPNLPINTIVSMNGSDLDAVYIGADIGIYYKDNDLTDFIPFSTGLTKAIVTDLQIFYPGNLLRASTYGRGTWESDLYSNPVGGTNGGGIDLTSIVLVPNPAHNTIEVKGVKGLNINFVMTDAQGKIVKEQQLKTAAQIDISQLPVGIYAIEIKAGTQHVATKRFVKQ